MIPISKRQLLFLPILVMLSVSYSQSAPICSFGSAPINKPVYIAPGETAETYIFFYNTVGTQPTHVQVFVDPNSVPPGFNVSLDPPLQKVVYNVSGFIQVISENLAVRPMPNVAKVPDKTCEELGIEDEYADPAVCKPKDVVYTLAPDKETYIPSKVLKVIIKAPKNATVGSSFTIRGGAQGFCLTRTGGIGLSYSRQWNIKVMVVSKEYYETVVKPKKGFNLSQIISTVSRNPFILVGIIVVIVGVTGFVSFKLAMKQIEKKMMEKMQKEDEEGNKEDKDVKEDKNKDNKKEEKKNKKGKKKNEKR